MLTQRLRYRCVRWGALWAMRWRPWSVIRRHSDMSRWRRYSKDLDGPGGTPPRAATAGEGSSASKKPMDAGATPEQPVS